MTSENPTAIAHDFHGFCKVTPVVKPDCTCLRPFSHSIAFPSRAYFTWFRRFGTEKKSGALSKLCLLEAPLRARRKT